MTSPQPIGILTTNAILQSDPTRTLTLRNAFGREMNKRFNELRRVQRISIDTNDAMGLREEPSFLPGSRSRITALAVVPRPPAHDALTAIPEKAFQFDRARTKVVKFQAWLDDQVARGILQTFPIPRPSTIGGPAAEAWTDLYITSAYQQGIKRARQELRKAGVNIGEEISGVVGQVGRAPLDDTAGTIAAFNTPFHIDRVEALFGRVFTKLQGITAEMATVLSETLAQGIAEGRNPRELARVLNNRIKGTNNTLEIRDRLGRRIRSQTRADLLARTEIIRAHHVATIREYERFGIVDIEIRAEFTTAGDNRVCPQCADLEGRIFKLEAVEALIPVHPRCRCIALPVVPGDPRFRDTTTATEAAEIVEEAS